jgi:secreted trypsin-like serine protease
MIPGVFRFMFSVFGPAIVLVGLVGVSVEATAQNNEAPKAVTPFQGRIVGGVRVRIQDYPWQAALKIQRASGIYMCGASLITQRWALTAAHCLNGAQKVAISIKTGDGNYNSDTPWDAVDDVVVHKDYNSATHEHDIALVKLNAPPKGRTVSMAGASLAVPM